MARRQSSFDDLIDIAAKLPWWGGIVLAVASYLILHMLAGMQIASPKGMQDLGDNIALNAVKVFAIIGQYLLPSAFLSGAVISAYRQWKRSSSRSRATSPFDEYLQKNENTGRKSSGADSASNRPNERIDPTWESGSNGSDPAKEAEAIHWSAELLAALEWKRFEEVCAALFERLGFATKMFAYGADGGVDIRLYQLPSNVPVAIVQCKAWTGKVGVNLVRELRGVMASEGVAEGIFVTTSTYSDDAIAFASGNQIDLMDGNKVLDSILKLPEEQQASLLRLATAGDYTTPTCPSCGVKMVLRTRKSGGKQFWGCVNYPNCTTILNVTGA